MIRSIQFSKFKALREARIDLGRFNLLIGPNGSGKTSVLQAIKRLRGLAGRHEGPAVTAAPSRSGDHARLAFSFESPFEDLRVSLVCGRDMSCGCLEVDGDVARWPDLRRRFLTIRAHQFDGDRIAAGAAPDGETRLVADGSNLAAVLNTLAEKAPDVFGRVQEEFCRILPEFEGISLSRTDGKGPVRINFRLARGGGEIDAEEVSQGSLTALAFISMGFLPVRPALVCLEGDGGGRPLSRRRAAA